MLVNVISILRRKRSVVKRSGVQKMQTSEGGRVSERNSAFIGDGRHFINESTRESRGSLAPRNSIESEEQDKEFRLWHLITLSEKSSAVIYDKYQPVMSCRANRIQRNSSFISTGRHYSASKTTFSSVVREKRMKGPRKFITTSSVHCEGRSAIYIMLRRLPSSASTTMRLLCQSSSFYRRGNVVDWPRKKSTSKWGNQQPLIPSTSGWFIDRVVIS